MADELSAQRQGVADVIEIELRNMNTISGELDQCQNRRAHLAPDLELTSLIKKLLLAGLLGVTVLSLVAAPAKITIPADKPGHPASLMLANLCPLSFADVKIADASWLPRQETNRIDSLPVNIENLEKSGNLEALRLAGQRATNGSRGPVYRDSDVYKALEAASYSLAIHPDPMLDRQLDEIIATLAAAQLAATCHWWPHKGTDEWAQYTWSKPITLSSAKVFWFDDTGRGECRLAASWRAEFLDAKEWKPVSAKGEYPVATDNWCEAIFSPVPTTSLRLTLKISDGWAAGVQEWQVTEADGD